MKRPKCSLAAWLLFAAVLSHPSHADTITSNVEGTQEILWIGSCRLDATYLQDFTAFDVTPWRVVGGSWIAHTPWAGDFGDAAFSDPRPSFPFTVVKDHLRIEARKVDDHWRSGLVASADIDGNGFGQTYGYFEISAKLPLGKGLWPAIWLASIKPKGTKETGIELDLMEHYGHFPGDFHSALHVWGADGKRVGGDAHVQQVPYGLLYKDFHQYGVQIRADWMVFFFDRQEYWRTRTPIEHKRPLMVLIDLGMGSGWPIDQAPSPSFLDVAYVRVWRERENTCQANQFKDVQAP